MYTLLTMTFIMVLDATPLPEINASHSPQHLNNGDRKVNTKPDEIQLLENIEPRPEGIGWPLPSPLDYLQDYSSLKSSDNASMKKKAGLELKVQDDYDGGLPDYAEPKKAGQGQNVEKRSADTVIRSKSSQTASESGKSVPAAGE